MTAPNVIWVYGQNGYEFGDTGTWDQSSGPNCSIDWPSAKYIRADAPEIEALVDALKSIKIGNGEMPCKPNCAVIGGYGYCSCGMEMKRNDLIAALAAWEALK